MKELKVSEVFANAMSVYKSRFWFFVGATLFAALLAFLGGALFVFVLGMALLVTYLLTTAQDRFYLRSCRGENVKLVSLFDTAKDLKSVKRVFCARGWADLWILIWGLIPVAGIVFAIIRYYEYSFVTYLISDREDLTATELKEESKRLTQGYKGKMFLIDFLFWLAIAVIVGILSLLGLIPYVGYAFMAIATLFVAASTVFIPPLLHIIHAEIYLSLTNGEAREEKKDEEVANDYSEEEEAAKLESVLPTA